ncbi:MAG: DUF4126 domain-containing protein [Chthoniobacter sp.]
MQVLQTLGVALGLASLAGLNVYLTVFVTGLAIQQHWIDISQTYPELAILAHPRDHRHFRRPLRAAILCRQDPVDRLPLGCGAYLYPPPRGAFLALRVLGLSDPTMEVRRGSAGRRREPHHAQREGRHAAGRKPFTEPFSNIALSLGEDVTVLGGLFLIRQDPMLALIVFTVILLTIGYLGPMIFRGARVQLWLIWKKIASPASDKLETKLLANCAGTRCGLLSVNLERDPIAWAAPCISTSSRGLPGNFFGFLVATERPGPRLASSRSAAGSKPPSNSTSLATRSRTSQNS